MISRLQEPINYILYLYFKQPLTAGINELCSIYESTKSVFNASVALSDADQKSVKKNVGSSKFTVHVTVCQ